MVARSYEAIGEEALDERHVRMLIRWQGTKGITPKIRDQLVYTLLQKQQNDGVETAATTVSSTIQAPNEPTELDELHQAKLDAQLAKFPNLSPEAKETLRAGFLRDQAE